MEKLTREEKLEALKILGNPARPLQKIIKARHRTEPGIPGKEGDDSASLRERSKITAQRRAARYAKK